MPRFVRWNTHLESNSDNIASVLQENGYMTGLAGKWHVGQGKHYARNIQKIKIPESIDDKKKVPLDDPEVNEYFKKRYELAVEDIKRSFGFDYVSSYYSGNLTGWPKSLTNFTKHNQDWITQSAAEFIDKSVKNRKPFFIYLSTTLQHGPEPSSSIEADRRITPSGLLDQPPMSQASYDSIYKRLDDAGISRKAAPSLWLDDGVGAVLDKLKKHGLQDNTAIFFFSDQQSWGKGSCYDGGVKTPLILSWPTRIKPNQTCDELVSNVDFVPTIFDICGITAPVDMKLDGKSILPTITGNYEPVHNAVFFELGNMRAVRTKDFKYIATRRYTDQQWNQFPEQIRHSQEYRRRYFRLNTEWQKSSPEHLKKSAVAKWRYDHAKYAEYADQLYDLRIDPGENVNLADNAEYTDILSEMKFLLRNWLKDMPGPYWEFKQATC
jgi:arylsulfatase A-like enzyme